MNLKLDMETFPQKTTPALPSAQVEKSRFTLYAHSAEQEYINEHGMRVRMLPAAVVTAQQTPPRRSEMYARTDFTMTAEDIDAFPSSGIVDVLKRIPFSNASLDFGTIVGLTIGRGGKEPLLIVDDFRVGHKPMEFLASIPVETIAQIDVLKSPDNTAIYGIGASEGVLVIYTKRGGEWKDDPIPSFHIREIMPLGYLQLAEFYAPKYETEAQRNNFKPDLRTTIHWQPVVQTDSNGVASFEFYTADQATSYTVVIEGLANDGTIIRKEGKVWR